MEETLHNGRLVRFGVFEVDLRSGELRKAGAKLKISGQPFQVLAILLENPGEIVTREDLLKRLWPDTFVDGDHNLNTAINKIREVLGDSAESPRFVETLPRRGYRFIAPVEGARPAMPPDALEALSESGSGSVVTATPRSRWLWVATAGLVLALTALLITWWRIPAAVPVVESVTQLTDDGESKSYMQSDGSRIYFNEGPMGSPRIVEVSVTGGAIAPVSTPFANPYVAGVKPDGSGLLILVPSFALYDRTPLWLIPLPAGHPRRIGNFETQFADIFPDGRIVFGQSGTTAKETDIKTDWFIADKDGGNPRKLVSLSGLSGSGPAGQVMVAPDGQTILLSQEAAGNRRLLEIRTDGTGLRELRKLGPDECCFIWTLDKKYLVYSSATAQQSDIWLLPMKTGLFRRPGKPIRLTNGPLPYSNPYPSRDGKQIFAFGTKQRGELVRYDMKSHQFEPFLSGISATDPTFSRDGKWVAYASYPDHNLWRSRSDGSERMQLTYPPMEVFFPSISPDGTKVAFHTGAWGGDKHEIYVISMEGKLPQRLVEQGAWAIWSPDGNYLSYQSFPELCEMLIDVRTMKKSALPCSQPIGGFWMTQDTLVGTDHERIQTFNLKTQKWTDLGPSKVGSIVNFMISPDDKYLYYTTGGADPKVERIRFSDQRSETIASLKDFHRALNNNGFTQVNVAPDGSPIFTRDTATRKSTL